MSRRLAVALAGVILVGCASSQERAALEARKENVVSLNTQLAAAYLQRGQPQVALEHVQKALTLAPQDARANNMMAVVQWRLGDHDEASKYFKRTVKLQPKSAEARNNYGAFLCERRDIDAAVQQFNLALTDPQYPTPARANLNAGLCLMKKPAPATAEAYFREALRLDPKLADALFHMAKITYDSGRTLAARGFMQRYFEVSADTPDSLLLAVKIESTLGAKDAEASYALRLKGKFPDSPQAKELHGLSVKTR
jgi:type IV pilus assembly protein PilF